MKEVLRVDLKLYESRRDRLRKLIDLNAPQIVLRNEAEIFLRCFHPKPWAERWDRWMVNKFPEWLLWLTSSQYREMKREEV